MLSRDDILKKKDLKKEKVNIPEWGGDVYVSEMTGESRDAWEQDLIDTKRSERKISNARAKLIIATVVDEKGKHLFTEQDIPALGKLSSVAMAKIVEAAQQLNGLTEREVEAAEKN